MNLCELDRAIQTLNTVRSLLSGPGELVLLKKSARGNVKNIQNDSFLPRAPVPVKLDMKARLESAINDFVVETCEVGHDYKIGASVLYAAFVDWFGINRGWRLPKQKSFGGVVSKKFERIKEGLYFYEGIRLKL